MELLKESPRKGIEANNGIIFNFNNITEDYEVAIRFHEANLETDYIAEGVLRVDDNEIKLNTLQQGILSNSFKAAVKQKSRWVYGITFQTGASTG